MTRLNLTQRPAWNLRFGDALWKWRAIYYHLLNIFTWYISVIDNITTAVATGCSTAVFQVLERLTSDMKMVRLSQFSISSKSSSVVTLSTEQDTNMIIEWYSFMWFYSWASCLMKSCRWFKTITPTSQYCDPENCCPGVHTSLWVKSCQGLLLPPNTKTVL